MANGFNFKESPVLRSVLKYISDKELTVGEKLPTERELMKIIGVSRNSLREALKSLEAIGVVEIRQGSGIYLMKDGCIAELGSHEELMAQNGFYHEMFLLQAQNYQESIPEEMLKGAAAYYG